MDKMPFSQLSGTHKVPSYNNIERSQESHDPTERTGLLGGQKVSARFSQDSCPEEKKTNFLSNISAAVGVRLRRSFDNNASYEKITGEEKGDKYFDLETPGFANKKNFSRSINREKSVLAEVVSCLPKMSAISLFGKGSASYKKPSEILKDDLLMVSSGKSPLTDDDFKGKEVIPLNASRIKKNHTPQRLDEKPTEKTRLL